MGREYYAQRAAIPYALFRGNARIGGNYVRSVIGMTFADDTPYVTIPIKGGYKTRIYANDGLTIDDVIDDMIRAVRCIVEERVEILVGENGTPRVIEV